MSSLRVHVDRINARSPMSKDSASAFRMSLLHDIAVFVVSVTGEGSEPNSVRTYLPFG